MTKEEVLLEKRKIQRRSSIFLIESLANLKIMDAYLNDLRAIKAVFLNGRAGEKRGLDEKNC